MKSLQQLKKQYQQYILEINKDNEHGNNFIDINLVYPQTDDIAILCEQLTDLKKCLDSFRPLNPAQLANLKEFYEVHYTYESNRIEGNTLTLQETYLVLNKGITIGGKPLQDHLEAVNHRSAFQYVQEIATSETDFSESVLLDIHDFILKNIDNHNAGKYRNAVGQGHALALPMQQYFEEYETQKNTIHPVILAANMHERLVTIHPFIDGNGRTARLVMNLILLKNDYPITNISGENESRTAYYKALESVQTQQNPIAFQLYLLQECKTSIWNYIQFFADNLEEEKKGKYFFEKVNTFF